MSKTPKTWKAKEAEVAARFNTKRNIGSGSLGRDERSHSDSTHERIYIECKYGDIKRWFAAELRKLLKEDTKKAEEEGKIFVAALKEKGQHGFWVMCHVDDLKDVAKELKNEI